jgi:hypothetical protein
MACAKLFVTKRDEAFVLRLQRRSVLLLLVSKKQRGAQAKSRIAMFSIRAAAIFA